MATYAQESMRFAVKEDIGDAVKLPPSLAGVRSAKEIVESYLEQGLDPETNLTREEAWMVNWQAGLDAVAEVYTVLVNSGMPAEDARGLLPTNILTRIHMRVDMKTLLNLAGMRLCTQAQFEWRAVFAELAKAIRAFGETQRLGITRWQYELIADSFRPVCYAAGHCPMRAKSDRACSIRPKVDELAANDIPSSRWEDADLTREGLIPIHPREWLADPTAARVAPGEE
jgi:hypothetical protein